MKYHAQKKILSSDSQSIDHIISSSLIFSTENKSWLHFGLQFVKSIKSLKDDLTVKDLFEENLKLFGSKNATFEALQINLELD